MFLHPLVVDLDGTLIHTDMLHESALRLFRSSPVKSLCIPLWLSNGKAILKQHLASRTDFDPETLPYNEELLGWLRLQYSKGRKLILCTASDQSVADSIAKHLDIFDDVIASDGSTNLSGKQKALLLEGRFGRSGFDYIGNSKADLAVWESSRHAVIVNAGSNVVKKAGEVCEIEQVFPPLVRGVSVWVRVLRVHQWLKNLLLFVPLLAAHELANVGAWFLLILAFFSFSLCASSAYIANDLLDLESDRLHPRKKNRPFAAGLVPIWMGVVLVPLLLIASFTIAGIVGANFLIWLVFYFVLTCAYSLVLKRFMLVDCLTLASLYTVRIIAGVVAIEQSPTFWLLAFSAFLFLSLAFVKRYTELEVQLKNGREHIHGRGYQTTDLPLIQTMGITSGYASVLVLALYLNSNAVIKLYQTPELIWGTVPLMLFWINWMWMQAHRSKMHDDPLVFALKDKASLVTGALFAAVLFIGAVGAPW